MVSLISKMTLASRSGAPLKLQINGKTRLFNKEIRLVLESGRTEYWTSELDFTRGLLYWYDSLGGMHTNQCAILSICGLSVEGKPNKDSDLVCAGVWRTRCNRPRHDGILYKKSNSEIFIVQDVFRYMKKNSLYCNLNANYNEDDVKR